MILTGHHISLMVSEGRIIIDPFIPSLLNPNSYNYRLGNTIYEIVSPEVDPKKSSTFIKHELTDDGFTLIPGRTYLGHTLEKIGSKEFVTSLIGRSSMGRLGLYLQITADLGHLGQPHCWTLELTVVQPLLIYPEMKIGQVSFWQVTDENFESTVMQNLVTEKLSTYTNSNLPMIFKPFKELISSRQI